MNKEEEGKFKLLRYFSLTGFAVILLSTLLTNLVLARIMHDALTRSSEKHAVVTANHLVHRLYEEVIAPQQERAQPIDWMSAELQTRIEHALIHEIHSLDLIKIKLYDARGMIIYSTDPDLVGMENWDNPRYQQALRGVPFSNLKTVAMGGDIEGESFASDVIETYVPVQLEEGGMVVRVLEIYQDVSKVKHDMATAQYFLVAATALFGSLAFACLLLLVRRADRIIGRQTAELHERNEALRQLDQLKTDLVHMIIHDLNNPLTGILGSLDLIARRGGLAGRQAEMLENARESSENMRRLITDMLDVSRMEERKLPLKRELLAVGEVVWPAVREARAPAASADKRLIVIVPDEVPLIQADRDILQRVVANLLSNATKHTARGGEIRVVAEYSSETDAVSVGVYDDGKSIPPEHLGHIFDKFVRGPSGARGTGLGLTFCKMAVEAHGGQIRVQSQVGEGSTFTFTIPLRQKDD